jgi:hypothetical protein
MKYRAGVEDRWQITRDDSAGLAGGEIGYRPYLEVKAIC